MTEFKYDIFDCRTLAATNGIDMKDLLSLAKTIVEDASADNIAHLIGAIAEKYGPRRRAQKEGKWVALAVGKDKTRKHINKLFAKDGKLVATDGHRVHVLNDIVYDVNKKVYEGWVDPKTHPCINVGQVFPNYEHAIPSYECATPIDIKDFVPLGIDWSGEEWGLSLPEEKNAPEQSYSITNKPRSAYFNAQYICDAFGRDEQMLGPDLSEYTPLDPLKLISHDGKRTAVVMPRRS